jgi:large subunit ribosomal protein L3
MGTRKRHAPRHGSLAYLPRKRAKNILARIRYWPKIEAEKPRLLGFMGYKVGMTFMFLVEEKRRSPNYGKEVIHSATILETPPILVCAIRSYRKSLSGLQTSNEAWGKDYPEELNRVFTTPKSFSKNKLKQIEKDLDKNSVIRVISITQPKKTNLSKKKPDIAEIEIGGGTIQQQLEYAKKLLNKEVRFTDVFNEGQYIDVNAVTIGKGFQGPVKRFGVKILQHKSRKTKRGVGTLGPWKPSRVLYSVPRAGQMGFHQRTEYNKRILKIGANGEEITPKGGFIRYGIVRGPYIILDGSVPGPKKRAIKLRYPARPPKYIEKQPPQITYLFPKQS